MKIKVPHGENTSVNPFTPKTLFRQWFAWLAFCALLLGALPGHAAVVTVDATTLTHGYMNVFALPASGHYPANAPGGFQFGSGWGLADLISSFGWSGDTNSVQLSPNTIGDPNCYWYNDPANGACGTAGQATGATGNKLMDASLYAEFTGVYVDQDLTFTATVVNSNLLKHVDGATNGWTSVAFIKDFAGDFSSHTQVTAPLTNGTFHITLHTSANAAHHIQWGFETIGPDVWAADPLLPTLESIQITNVVFSAPTITIPPSATKVVLGNNATFSVTAVGTITGYQWKSNGSAITDGSGKYSGTATPMLTINNCQLADAGKYSVTVSGAGPSVSATNTLTVIDPSKITINPNDNWIGYMNWSGQPDAGADPGTGASAWGTADLVALFSGPVLSLSPNVINDAATYWYIGGGAPGNPGCKAMDASMYVETTGLFQGANLTFSGFVLNTNLLSLASTNQNGHGWTCTAFIKDLASDYSSSMITRVDLSTLTGPLFSVSAALINDPTRHVQWGFETIGPNVWTTDPILPGLGKIVVAPYTYVVITPRLSGSSLNLSFPTQTGFAYTVQCKTNLTDVAWTTLTVTNGTGSTVVVTNAANAANRFYRLSIQ